MLYTWFEFCSPLRETNVLLCLIEIDDVQELKVYVYIYKYIYDRNEIEGYWTVVLLPKHKITDPPSSHNFQQI